MGATDVEISVEGYQSVAEEQKIRVSGLTVVLGESSTGKSAFFRAVTNAFANQKGNHFITVGKDECRVTVAREGQQVTWTKTQTSSQYVFNGEVHKKAGKSTPEQELAKLGVYPVKAHDRTYWPQVGRQFDQPFIIAERSPIAAAELMSASKEAARLARAVKRAQEVARERSAAAGLHQAAYDGLKVQLDATEAASEDLEDSRERLGRSEAEAAAQQARHEALAELRVRYAAALGKARSAALAPRGDFGVEPDAGRERSLEALAMRWRRSERESRATAGLGEAPQAPVDGEVVRATSLAEFRSRWIRVARVAASITGLGILPGEPSAESWVACHQLWVAWRAAREVLREGELDLQECVEDLTRVEEWFAAALVEVGQCPLCGVGV